VKNLTLRYVRSARQGMELTVHPTFLVYNSQFDHPFSNGCSLESWLGSLARLGQKLGIKRDDARSDPLVRCKGHRLRCARQSSRVNRFVTCTCLVLPRCLTAGTGWGIPHLWPTRFIPKQPFRPSSFDGPSPRAFPLPPHSLSRFLLKCGIRGNRLVSDSPRQEINSPCYPSLVPYGAGRDQ
jgi:hypothetical protein